MTDSEAVMNLLRKVPLFANLKDEDKVCIEEAEGWQLPEGELLVKAGEPAEHFFVLLEGEISLSKKQGDQEIVVARYRPGAFFGEVPLLLGVPYILTARAESDSRLIVFAEEGFWRLLRLCPAISSEIFRAMVTRLRNLEGSKQQQKSWPPWGQWQWNPTRGPAAHLCGALLHNQGRLRDGTRPGYHPQDRRRTA